MQVTRKLAIPMFKALGIRTASSWNDARLAGKLSKVNKMADSETELDDPELKKLLDAIIVANDAGEEVELIDEGADAETPKKKSKKKVAESAPADVDVPMKKSKAKGKAAKAEVKGAKATKATKEPKAAKAVKAKDGDRVTVTSSIIEFLSKASAKKPLTRDQVLEQLEERFPDRKAEEGLHGMAITVSVQVPRRLRERGVKVEETATKDGKKAYYIAS